MSNKDRYNNSPSDAYEAITPSDTVDLKTTTRSIYVGGAGDIVAVDVNDNTVTFSGAVAGTTLPIVVKRVNATSTTATNLVALF